MDDDATVYCLTEMGTERYILAETVEEALAIAGVALEDLDYEPERTNWYEASSRTDEIEEG